MKALKEMTMVGAATLLFAMVACNNGSNDSVKQADSANTANIDTMSNKTSVTDSSGAVPSKQDADFMVKAASGGLLEVELGRLAQDHGASQSVKDFGAMMVKDHSRGGEELKALAANKRIVLPDSISNDQRKMRDDMAKMRGGEFDRHYMGMMVNDHKEDIDEFNKAAQHGNDPDIKAFATNHLAMLQQHLDSATRVKGSLKGQ